MGSWDGIEVGSYFVAADGSVQIRGNDVMGNRTASLDGAECESR